MAIKDWVSPFNKVLDIAKEAITDKDKLNQFNHELDVLKQQVYLVELGTKTVPWIDGLHKMGRQILSVFSLAAGIFILYQNPDVDPLTLGAVLAPGGIYNAVKGRGK